MRERLFAVEWLGCDLGLSWSAAFDADLASARLTTESTARMTTTEAARAWLLAVDKLVWERVAGEDTLVTAGQHAVALELAAADDALPV